MKSLQIETPSFQNWSCQGCGDCCRGYHRVAVTAEEKRRIEAQDWSAADAVDPRQMIVTDAQGHWLGHQADGACVFLDAAGRCRIHARFGEAAKPLACRLYPFALHPAGKKLVVSLRFSCPAAVANRGLPLASHLAALRELAARIVPANFQTIPPPPVLGASRLAWPDFLRFVARLDMTLTEPDGSLLLRLLRSLHWLKAVETARFDQITGAGAEEILDALTRRAKQQVPAHPLPPPSRVGRLLFRTLVMQYARRETVKDRAAGVRYRWNLLVAMLRFALASGHTPALGPGWPRVSFAAIEKPGGALPPEAEAMLTRFFRVKVRGLHFCGRAYYDVPLIEGFRSLALLYPVILWLARWQAAGTGDLQLTCEHVARAVATADHHHGYLPLLGTPAFRWRVRLLAQRAEIARLCSAAGG